ncbi:MAG: hypothetical protein K2J01_03425 [Clostridiales bacterium]|nr:hypothetical protein [Clostridiales bacterium]
MKNVSHSPVTEMLSGRHKIWLIIGLALLPIADFAACVALWVFGAASSYWWLPFFMTAVDVLYLVGVILSNQRFKYAQKLFFVYIAVTIVLLIVWLVKFVDGSAVVLTDTVEAYCGLLHVAGILAVGISYLYASRRLRLGRHIQLVFAIIFSAVVLLAFVVTYGVFVISDGFFGQGHGNLPLVYAYTENNECTVTDIVYGRGDSVVIPYEFNGRKVTGVSANIFTYAYVKNVTLNCDPDVELCADMHSEAFNTNVNIYVDKKDVDTIKQKLYTRDSGNYSRYRHELGNRVQPIGLDNDEVYITFNYDRDAYDTARGKIIPTWFGKKGDTFRLSDIDGVDYAEHSDADSDDDLYYCYNHVGNGGGYMMSELKDGDKALDGITVDQSRGIAVSFQKIYKVFAGESNDTKYKTDEYFPFATVNGVKQDYKLTVMDKADELLDSFDRGEAFTRTMHYTLFNGNVPREFTSLSALLREGYSQVTIAPDWELTKPQVTLTSVTAADDIIYGDDFILDAAVTHPIGDVQIEYEWYDDTQRIGYDRILQANAESTGMHTYTAIVKVSAPEVTSCISGNAAEIKVNVNKRPLTITWEHKSIETMGGEAQVYGTESVYDGNQRGIQPKAQNVVNNDYIFLMGYTGGHAGTFTEKATLTNNVIAAKYYIAEGETYTYTIHPYPVQLTWDNDTEFEYDGNVHGPTAHALDLSGEELEILYSGRQTDAGENYTATAILANADYTINESSVKSKGFKITPTQVSVTWGRTTLTYNGDPQAPEATALGVGGVKVNLDISGKQTNANKFGEDDVTTTYTATAASANKNYTLDPTTTSTEFTISPYVLVYIQWANSVVTYNGQSQLPTATVTGAKNQNVPLTVIIEDHPLGAVDAGQYIATATVADPNYTIYDGPLFALDDEIQSTLTAAQWQFYILPMEVRAQWGNTTLTYNGEWQVPSATAKGVNGEDLPLTVTGALKIGNGTANAEFTAKQNNYTLTDAKRTFTIQRKVLNISIDNVTVEYGQKPNYTYSITGVVDGEYVTVTLKVNYLADSNGNIPVGEYTITATLSISDSTSYSLNIVQSGKLTVTAAAESTEE